MTSIQKTKIETFRGNISTPNSKRDGEYRVMRRKGPVYLVLASFAFFVPLATVSFSLSNAVVAKERMRASDLAGTWYGKDGRTYIFRTSVQGRVSLRIRGPEREGTAKPDFSSSPITISIVGAERVGKLTYRGKFDLRVLRLEPPLVSKSTSREKSIKAGMYSIAYRKNTKIFTVL